MYQHELQDMNIFKFHIIYFARRKLNVCKNISEMKIKMFATYVLQNLCLENSIPLDYPK